MNADAGMLVVRPAAAWEARTISWAAFAAGFFFSFRAAMAMISARWLGLGSEAGVSASFAIEALLLLGAGFEAIGAAQRPLRWITRQAPVRWVFFFLAFSCSSLLWSATVSRAASFSYWCAMGCDVAIVVLLLRARGVDEAARSLLRGFIVSTCVLACMAWMMPAAEDLRLGDADYFNTNQIGNLCAMAVLMAQFLGARRDGNWKLPIFFLTVTLLRSLSKATIIAFIVAEGILLFCDRSMARRAKASIALAAVLLVAAYWGLMLAYFDDYTTTGNQAESLTGRTAIWAYTLDASLERPWMGNGMDAMWKVFPPFGRDKFEARHAENELLQQFFAYGAAGVVMLAGLYGSLWRRILKLPRRPDRAVLGAILLFVIIRGLAEAEPFDLLLPLWMITLLSCVVQEPVPASQPSDSCKTVLPKEVRAAVAATGGPAV